jgi:lysophospholipase L1-like esterase
MIEDYLVVCRPDLDVRCIQLGLSGDCSWGLASRLDRDCLSFKPNVLTICYGMNDGGYHALTAQARKAYSDAMGSIIVKTRASGAIVIAGGPGAVDTFTFDKSNPYKDGRSAKEYNVALGELGDIVKGLADKEGQIFADVHGPLMATMAAAKAEHGQEFPVCGGDGIHPGPNGSLVMAYVFLKAMGLDGQIGTITVDMSGGAQATDGHKVLAARDGVVELESTRYPLCFTGDLLGGEKGDCASSALEHIPFNQELNRLMLVVRNLKSGSAKVTWGSESKTFARRQLADGVNLADEFRKNPFCEAFSKVDKAVARKQNYDSLLVNGAFSILAQMEQAQGDDKTAIDEDRLIKDELVRRERVLEDRLRTLVVPVKHTIQIQPQ